MPSDSVEIDVELGDFVLDGDLAELGLRWNFVAKGYAAIKNPKTEGENPTWLFFLGEIKSSFVIIVRDETVFAPRQFDGFFVAMFLLANEFEILTKRVFAANEKSKPRRADESLVAAVDAITDIAIV